MIDNPYSAPEAPLNVALVRLPVRRRAALGFLAGSIGFVVIYMTTLFPLMSGRRGPPVLPVLLVPFLLSIVCAYRTRSVAIAPLACILGCCSGSLIGAAFRGWAFSALHLMVPIALRLSVPSIFIATYSRRHINASPKSFDQY